MEEERTPMEDELEIMTGSGQESEKDKKKRRKRSFRRGLAAGIASTLIVVIIAGFVGMSVLKNNGYAVRRDYVLEQDAVDDVLSAKVQNKIAELVGIVGAYYYEDFEVNDLVEGMYSGLVDSLGDQYSGYFTPENYASYMESATGKYYGIGALLTQDLKTMQVSIMNVYEGTPAEEAGLRAGDVVVRVEDIEATSCELSELVTHIKGEKGTHVNIVVTREGTEGELTFSVERREIKVPTITYQMLDENIGYISISEFGEVTAEQFEKAVQELKKRGMTSVMIDLRDNPGGMLSSVTEILDDILPKGLLVYTEDKDGNRDEYYSDSRQILDMPMVVLVNGNSASASEIFAGAIRDYEYGTLIGTNTFGKGIVQILLPLEDGSAVKLTTSKYFTPNGDYIHGKGIAPDIELEYEYQGSKEEDYDIMKDNQVLKGIEVLKEKNK